MANLNQSILLSLEIVLHNMDTQLEIVRRTDALTVFADRIEARYAAARAQAQRLTPLLLAKAFRGELVPQDPNDEPACALLERIAAQRAKPSEPKLRKPRSPRASPRPQGDRRHDQKPSRR